MTPDAIARLAAAGCSAVVLAAGLFAGLMVLAAAVSLWRAR